MLTVVNQTKTHKVVKNHKGTLVFSFQVHDKNNPLNPVIETFKTKWEADKFIGHAPKAPVKETKANKDYPQFTGSSKNGKSKR